MPVYRIMNTEFYVDVNKNQLLEKDNPSNTISFADMDYRGDHYVMRDYDQKKRNLAAVNGGGDWVEIPQLKVLDPVGMARKFSKSVADLEKESDFTLTVDQRALERRLSGQRVSISICDHPFYIDVRAGLLEPKGVFSTRGMVADDLEDLGDRHATLYNPKTYEAVYIPPDEIYSVPKGLVLIEFPTIQQLDPVGWFMNFEGASFRDLKTNKETIKDLQEHLMKYPRLEPLPARIVPWTEIQLDQIIAENIARRQKEKNAKMENPGKKKQTKKGKGKGL